LGRQVGATKPFKITLCAAHRAGGHPNERARMVILPASPPPRRTATGGEGWACLSPVHHTHTRRKRSETDETQRRTGAQKGVRTASRCLIRICPRPPRPLFFSPLFFSPFSSRRRGGDRFPGIFRPRRSSAGAHSGKGLISPRS